MKNNQLEAMLTVNCVLTSVESRKLRNALQEAIVGVAVHFSVLEGGRGVFAFLSRQNELWT